MTLNFNKSVIVCILLFMILVGCSQSESRTNDQESQQSQEVEEIVASNGFVYERGDRNLELHKEGDFNPFLENNEKVLVVFYATWCRYCQELDTYLPEILEEIDNLLVMNVDIEKFPAIANAFQAVATPTVVYFEQGQEPRGFRGALPAEMIVEFIEGE